MTVEIDRWAPRVLAAPPLPPVYDSGDTYESPGGIGGARHNPFGYERGNTKEVPKGIGDTPQCMIVKTRMTALGGIGGLGNTLSDMRVIIRRRAPRVLAVPPTPPPGPP